MVVESWIVVGDIEYYIVYGELRVRWGYCTAY